MEPYQRQFLQFAVDAGVLRFGRFTLKSGRQSPYFFDAGLFDTGVELARLGVYYARAIRAAGISFDMVFGPAYKGIVLVSTVSIALATGHGMDIPYAFNRKEVKDHGEGGIIVGAPLRGDVLIIDDVISAGLSVAKSVDLIRAAGARPAGVVIALDRQERGRGDGSAIDEVIANYGIPVYAIARLDDLLGYLESSKNFNSSLKDIKEYKIRYGV